MEKTRKRKCGDDEDLILPLFPKGEGDDEALIESPFFTSTTFNSNKFGSFILLALVNRCSPKSFKPSRKHSLIRLSSLESGSESGSGSGGWRWWSSSDQEEDDRPDYYEDQVFKVMDNNNNNLGEQQQLVLKLDSLGVPSCYESCYFFKEIAGSCNGVVCLYDRDANRVSLWNPATKQHRVLPRPIKIGGDCPNCLVAFGFDVETKDYKVVLLTGFRSMYYRPASPIECLCRVQVYSLSTDSWRLVEGITCLPGDPFQYLRQGLYLNGSCFFIAHFFHTKQQRCIPENNRFIISFDFTKEIITPIQLPDHHRDQELYLTYLGDQIALFTKSYHNGTCVYEDYNIWVLREHGSIWVLREHGSSSSMNKESWTKFRSFQIQVKRPGEGNIPRGISNDGEFALLETKDSTGLGKRIKLYHFVSKEVKKNFLSCSLVMSIANAYIPTLVSVTGGNGGSSSNR